MTIHDLHWGIETFHRAIKQVCGICRFMVRDTDAIKTHILCSIQAFIKLEIISRWKSFEEAGSSNNLVTLNTKIKRNIISKTYLN